jgi:Immunoglobulin I-set domain
MRQVRNSRKNSNSTIKRLANSASFALEQMESRIFLSTTLAAWTFENDSIAVNNSPAASSGSGTASSIGMNVYPTPNIGVTQDDVVQGASSDTGNNNNADLTQVWRIRGQAGSNGPANGWSSAAPIGAQGAVFAASTVGYSTPLTVNFDWYATTQGEANLQLEYTTDGTDWINVPITLSTADTGLAVVTNTGSDANSVVGSYVSDNSKTNGSKAGQDWFPGLSATITDPNAANDPNFAVELVNASTGADCVATNGNALNNSSGNWRFDNISISSGGSSSAPNITQDPANAKIAPGGTAMFTAAATGSPAPTVQWEVSTNNGLSYSPDTLDMGAQTNTLTVAGAPMSDSGNQYEALFTNTSGTATSTAATLTVTTISPSVTANPTTQVIVAGASATFTAAATGLPAPTVQWEVSTDNGLTFNPDTLDMGAQTNTLTISAATTSQSGIEYEAIYSNTAGTATTTPAALIVAGAPLVVGQPASQTVPTGSSVTLIASAIGNPTPSTQWYVSTDSGSDWTLIPSATNSYLSITTTEASSGDEYEAVFSSTAGTATSTPANITVLGTPIVEYDFTTGQSATPGGDTQQGSGNSPFPTFQINSSNDAEVLGMVNAYDGLPSEPEADIIPIASGTDSAVEDYVWRVRGGEGKGPTGSPGTPDGWSQNAPEDTQAAGFDVATSGSQGVGFDVNTTGFSNVVLHFDWTQGAIGDMQPQYYNTATSLWTNVGTPIQATGTDYYGVSATTTLVGSNTFTADVSTTISVASSSPFFYDQPITVGGISAIVTAVSPGSLTILPTASGSAANKAIVTASPDPTGVTINLQGIAEAVDNSDLQVRLISVYDPALPSITDGNPAVSSLSHGQYASGFGGANDIQVIDLDDYVSSGGTSYSADGQNFTLSLNGQTTSLIQYNSNPTTMAANIQAALLPLVGTTNGTANVTVSSTFATNTYVPPGPITSFNGFSVIFNNGLKDTAEPTMVISDSNDNVSTWQNAESTVSTTTTTAYTVTANTSLTVGVLSTTNFTAGNPILLGTISCLIDSVGANSLTVTPEASGSVIIGATVKQLGVTGFVDGGGSWEFGDINFTGDVISGGPGITANPTSQSIAAGFPVTFTASAYSESLPTVQWQFSDDNGATWTNVATGTTTPTGGIFSQSSNDSYTSTYTFTTDNPPDQSGFEYRAEFSSTVGMSSVSTDSSPATLTVVPPQAPYVLIQPSSVSVEQGDDTFFTTYGAGSPTPSVQWQISTNNGSSWSNLTDTGTSITVNGSTSDTLTVDTFNNTTQNGDLFRAEFMSSAGTTYSATVTMNVLPTNYILTDWDFNALYPTVTSASGSPDPLAINPTPVPAGTDNSLDVGGVATPLGMNLPYNPNDPASGTTSPGAVDDEDIVNSGPGVVYSNFTENTWRIRSGPNDSPASGGSPANGWSNFVPQYTQGGEFAVPTTGFSDIYVTLDWFSTHSGEQDAQEQYTLDGTNWFNLGPQLQLYAPGNDDWYGDSSISPETPVVFDLTGIPGASNNPNLAVRLVNSYNLVLSNQQTITLNDANNFTLSFNGQNTGTIAFSPVTNTMAANIDAALAVLPNVGGDNVSVTFNSTSGAYVVQFMGTLGTSIQPVMTVAETGETSPADTVSQQDEYANAQLNSNGNPFSVVAYNGSKGNWRFDNIVFHGTADSTWTLNGGDTWNNGNDWTVITPGNAGDTANFTTNLSAPSVVTLDGDHSLGELNFDSADSYTLAPGTAAGVLTMDNGSATAEINVTGGSDLITAPLVLNSNTVVNIAEGDTLTISGGISGVGSLTVMGGGQLILGSGLNTVGGLNIASDSSLDLGSSELLVNYGATSPQSAVQSYISDDQLVSSFVTDNGGYGIGYADGADGAVTGLVAGEFEIEPALIGDTDLSGIVNIHDLQNVLSDFNVPGAWDQGNFNGHANVDISDLQALLTNFNSSTALSFSEPSGTGSVVHDIAESSILTVPDSAPSTLVASPTVDDVSTPSASVPSVDAGDDATPSASGPIMLAKASVTKKTAASSVPSPTSPIFSQTPITASWLQSLGSVLGDDAGVLG